LVQLVQYNHRPTSYMNFLHKYTPFPPFWILLVTSSFQGKPCVSTTACLCSLLHHKSQFQLPQSVSADGIIASTYCNEPLIYLI
jgi:hypothetical protein